MTEHTIKDMEEEIKRIIAEVIEEDPSKLGADVNFFDDLGVDSIKAIEITVALEKKLGIVIRDNQIPRIGTVGEALALVKNLMEKKNK